MLSRTETLIRQGMDDRLHLGAQLYVSLKGGVVADAGMGEVRSGEPMTSDKLMLWLSSCKPITALAVARLWEQGEWHPDDPVARYVPEFARGNKQSITIRHVLTHTGGFRGGDAEWKAEAWEATIDRICATPLESGWVPGEKAGYHLDAGWYMLAEMIRRITSIPFAEYIGDQILRPLGMQDSWISMTAGEYRVNRDRLGVMYVSGRNGLEPHAFYNSEAACTQPRPGSSGRGPMRDLGRFYEALLQGGDGIVSPETVRTVTSRQRVGLFDHTFQCVLDWGWGFIPDNNRYGVEKIPYGYGVHCSERTFGHSGSQSSTGFADPAHGLVVALALNGMPGEMRHQKRMRPVLSAMYEDLGLVR